MRMYYPEVELPAIIIGLLLIGTALLCNRKKRTGGSRYYKVPPGLRE